MEEVHVTLYLKLATGTEHSQKVLQ